ncbi:MAG: hypothetical protein A2X05_14900 [Bacteroidetes bacterium GWE2_41_25]|nr:MAG: hypothetical protein A2X03_10895 [Bacteroidetes bacterium GWA2_40_15]OFX96138.1 MAG: hypothetical protein A2X06_03170 [Bacteroidetes bacterium GWC2_40_22]OFX98279.1 MAG: hypothetical protein A2X05_14900 [Bacteroidetes bacterium GWE2_41_25]
MANSNQFRSTVGWITILSGIVGFISYFLVAGSVNFNFDFFSNPVLIFSIPDVNIGMLRWSMIADIFGYYLLLLPALYFIHEWLRDKTAWRNLITFCGTSYILVGAVGASILSVTWTTFLTKFPISTPEQQETIKLLFESFSLMVGNGMWNLFDTIVCGVWMVSIGIFIKREKSFFGWFTIIVGVISLFDGLGNILEIKAMADIAVNLYLILAPAWAIFLGVSIVNKSALNNS